MSKRKALGSGLEALLSSKPEKKDTSKASISSSSKTIQKIPIDKISRNINQPRKLFFDEPLESMAASIKEFGQKVPILVRKTDSGYELIAGERRWRAMQSIQQENIEAIILEATDKESALIAIVENVQREQLNVIEEAEALLTLNNEFEMTHDDISKYTGRSRSHVSNILRLNGLADFIKLRLAEGAIEMGHARAILTLAPNEQEAIIKQAVNNKLSVRAVENLVKNYGKRPNKKSQAVKNQDTIALERRLSETIGADLRIYHSKAGSGKIEIKYKTLNELEGIVSKIKPQ